jgi:hypothetical protein
MLTIDTMSPRPFVLYFGERAAERARNLKKAENFEKAGKFEEAALIYEAYGMRKKAGEMRRMARTT